MSNFTLGLVLFVMLKLCTANPYYCYSQDPEPPHVELLHRRDSVETWRGDDIDPYVSNCTASKFWMFSRHGTVYPQDVASILGFREGLYHDILRNYDAGRTSLCAGDIARIRNWEFNLTVDQSYTLSPVGWNEFFTLAQRYQTAYPTALPSNYSLADYFFRTVSFNAAHQSLMAFADGLFGPGGNEPVQFADIPNPDLLLRPGDYCPLFDYIRLTWADAIRDLFQRGVEFEAMLTEVSAKLGFHGAQTLRKDDIDLMQNLCAFEVVHNSDGRSPFCAAFSAENFRAYEYDHDVFIYWLSAYGPREYRTFMQNRLCRLMQDMLHFIRSDDPNDHKARLFTGLNAEFYGMLVALGVYEDDVVLSPHNYAHQFNRLWKGGKLAPSGTNLVVIRFDCDDEDNEILFMHNDRPLHIAGCQPSGICKQSTLMQILSRFIDIDCDDIACSN